MYCSLGCISLSLTFLIVKQWDKLENKIIDHAKRCKKYKPNAAIREHEASMKYERLMRERRAQLAREADERMKASTAYALRFIFKERYKNGQ